MHNYNIETSEKKLEFFFFFFWVQLLKVGDNCRNFETSNSHHLSIHWKTIHELTKLPQSTTKYFFL